MPAFSNEYLYTKLYTDGKVKVSELEVTTALLEELQKQLDEERTKKQSEKVEKFVSRTGQECTRERGREILALFTVDPFTNGFATMDDRHKKLTSMSRTMQELAQKSTLSLEEANIAYTIKKDLNTYFMQFDQQAPDVIEANFTNNISIEDYKKLFDIGFGTSELYNKIEKGAEEAVKRDQKVSDFEIFVDQFETLQNKQEITEEIQVQYDTYVGRVQEHFQSVAGNVDLLSKTHFQNLNAVQFKELDDRVTHAYDTLRIKYNRLVSVVE